MKTFPVTVHAAVDGFVKTLTVDEIKFLAGNPILNRHVDNGAYEFVERLRSFCGLSEGQILNESLLNDVATTMPADTFRSTFLDEKADPETASKLILKKVFLRCLELSL